MGLCVSSVSRDDMKGKYGEMYGDYLEKEEKFQITMCQAPCEETGCFCASMLCLTCSLMKMRHKALNHVNPGSGWDDYMCCQGEFGSCCCFTPGEMGESSCPIACACLEAWLCPGPAVSSTSMVMRRQYNLGIDDGDVCLIQTNNCILTLAVLAQCLGMCFDWEGEEECIGALNLAADIIFCCVSACMTAQTNHEINHRENLNPPASMEMTR